MRSLAEQALGNATLCVFDSLSPLTLTDGENEDDDEDERFARPATIWIDTDRLQVCATGAASTLNPYQGEGTAGVGLVYSR
jgi:hypothetical protein